MGFFGAYFVINYLITYRKTLRSISKLQAGIGTIGSGNLDYSINAGKKDEIADISKSVNHMAANLKAVTASKAELEQTQIALRKSEQRWSTTLSSIGDAVIATDVSGAVTFMNGISQKLTGWTLSEALGSNLKEVFHIVNEDTRCEVESPVAKVLEKGLVVGLANHSVLMHKDGSETPIDDSGAPIKDDNGNIVGVVLVFHDITERKKAEEALQQTQAKLQEYANNLEKLVEERTKQLNGAQRLATIGATAGMVGHDIRNPLQAITCDLYFAKTELAELPNSEQKKLAVESLDEIQINIDYINKIVADLQDYAKPLNPRAQETNLKALFNEIVTKNGVPENIKLTVDVEDEAEIIMADPDYLKRIVSNLTLNAAQAMPNGGTLTIHAFTDKKTNDILITVKDTGVGIPEDVKPKLFTPMITTKAKGQGFGLAVVKRITEGLGGTVSFESEVDKGTTFIVRLPPPKELNGKWTYK